MASLMTWWGALFGTALGLVGVLVFLDGLGKLRRAYRLTVVPRSDLARLSEYAPGAVVQVTGTVEPTEPPVTAPYSKADCVLWKTTAQYYSQLNSPAWRTVTAAVHGDRFALSDHSGRVAVDASAADVELPVTEEGRCPADPEAAPPRLEPFLTREGGEPYATVELTGRDLKLLEQRVDPGSEVTVLGEVDADGSISARQVGGVGRRGIAAMLAAAGFQTVFGAFLISVLWFVALPNWGRILSPLLLSG